MSDLPKDGKGRFMQLFQPHAGYVNKDNTLAAVSLVTVPLIAFHCHADGTLTCTTPTGDVAIPCIEGMQWAFPEGTSVVTITTGNFSFM